MANTITTNSSIGDGGARPNARHLDRCRNGVRWAMCPDVGNTRLEFFYSTNDGVSWSEITTRRITDADVSAGHSMRVISGTGSGERLVVVYREQSTNLMRCHVGIFNDARTSFKWHSEGPKDVSKGSPDADWTAPDIEGFRLQGDWWVVPCIWARVTSGNWASVWLGRVRFTSGTMYAGPIQRLHSRGDMSTHPYPSIALRHFGSDAEINLASPDLYVGWGQGLDGDPNDRSYMLRNELSGYDWQNGTRRVVEEDGVSSGNSSSCFTGQRFAMCVSPNEGTTGLLLFLMSPDDSQAVERYELPDLGQGEITNVSVTWDTANADVYVLASGATDDKPYYVIFEFATRTFGSWVKINDEVTLPDTLSAKPGSRGSEIECLYAIDVTGTQTRWRYESVTTTNVAPNAPSWNTSQGVQDTSSALILDWNHNDPDGDAQAQYELRRKISDGAYNFWNGTNWQTSSVQPSSATTQVTLNTPWGAPGDTISYSVRTNDGQVWSPWSPSLTVQGSTAVNPTIVSPVAGPITSSALTTQWTVSEQSAFRWLVRLTSSGDLLYDSDWRGDPGARYFTLPFMFINGVGYTLELLTQNDQGLPSALQSVAVTAALDPPPTPIVTLTANVTGIFAAIDVAVDNGTPGGGEDAAVLNYAFRRRTADPLAAELLVSPDGFDADTTFTDHSVPAGTDVSYRVEAETADGVRASSAVVSTLS